MFPLPWKRHTHPARLPTNERMPPLDAAPPPVAPLGSIALIDDSAERQICSGG
jgi:hypothetical protein